MKIAINCIFCQPKGGGIKEYIVNLTNHIALCDQDKTYILYVLEDQLEFAKKLLPQRFQIKVVPFKSDFLSVVKRSLFSQRFWTKEEKTERFDIFHSPFFHAPKMKKAKLILTVHDLRLYRYPQTYNPLRYMFLKRAVKDAISRADHIISISEFTKQEMVELCGVSPEKITVIYEAVNRNAFSEKQLENYVLPKEYTELGQGRILFSLGHIEPRKNYPRLIEAFKKLKEKEENQDLKLVIAGKKYVDYINTIRLMEETPDVVYLDFIPRELLLWLYKNATLFVFPSTYEGFGFPPLEAASMGTISAVSNVSSIPEVCGDCAFYFNPYDVDNMAATIEDALNNAEGRQKKEKLLETQLNKTSWEQNAADTIKLYQTI
ncbi:MAG: glycosyltransferase family 4 protein [Prevotella sp.]|nr:glycosyltransferase family 4 protein [Prevotella sp.]